MLTPKPLATAIAALALCVGTATADDRHRNEIHVESFSWGISSPSAAAAGDLAVSAPGRSLPAVQGRRETITLHGHRTEAAGVAPLTPLEDPRLKAQTSSKPPSEYMKYKFYDLLISSYQTSANDSALPAKQRFATCRRRVLHPHPSSSSRASTPSRPLRSTRRSGPSPTGTPSAKGRAARWWRVKSRCGRHRCLPGPTHRRRSERIHAARASSRTTRPRRSTRTYRSARLSSR